MTRRPVLSRMAILGALAVWLPLLVRGAVWAQTPRDPYSDHIAPTGPRTALEQRATFRLPPGFEIQLVAAEPEIPKPMNLAFDARGRLWVTGSGEYPFPAAQGKGRDSVKILEDFGPDGRARKVTTFAEGLNIPIGLLPLPPEGQKTSALVYTIPQVLRLTDTDGDGKADRREVLYSLYGTADTHGMTSAFTPGLDGWIYACHGFANTSTLKGKDGHTITLNSGNIYRMRPDGQRVEQHTWGQVNPFGLCLDALGNLYSADCHTQPIYQVLRGAYYPSFGKPHDGLGFGPEMITNYKGSTAIAGVVVYEADHFPADHVGTAYVGDVVTNCINQFRLSWTGSSPRAHQQEFVTSSDPWFRPVDLKLGPDGALYVADFYNRIIGHYEVPLTHPARDRERARIWRIVYRGPSGTRTPPAPPRNLSSLPGTALVAYLGHPNLALRLQAAELLAAQSWDESLAALRGAAESPDALARSHALWVLHRRGRLDSSLLEGALRSNAVLVRVHALGILGAREGLEETFRPQIIASLKDPEPRIQRAAAEVLGRHPNPIHVSSLLEQRKSTWAQDTHLVHTQRMALRDTLRRPESWPSLSTQLREDGDRRLVADVALGVPSAEAARFLVSTLRLSGQEPDRLFAAVHHVARHGVETGPALLTAIKSMDSGNLGHQAALVRAVEQGTQERGQRVQGETLAWASEVTNRLLESSREGELRMGIELTGALRLGNRAPRLAELIANRRGSPAVRTAAMTALATIDPGRATTTMAPLLVDANESFPIRDQAGAALARMNTPEALTAVSGALPAAPAQLQTTLAMHLLGSPAGVEQLLKAVEAGKASPRLLREPGLEPRLSRSAIPGVVARVAALTKGLPPADQRVQELLTRRRAGFTKAQADLLAGAKVFEKHCSSCHQIAGKGAKIGPQLDGIGLRGLDRLLEDILDPNRNVDQAFRLTTLTTKSGQVVSGLLLREEGEVYVLADAQGKEVRLSKASVEERTTAPLSPMPANLTDQIPETDFYPLMAYLLAQKPMK